MATDMLSATARAASATPVRLIDARMFRAAIAGSSPKRLSKGVSRPSAKWATAGVTRLSASASEIAAR